MTTVYLIVVASRLNQCKEMFSFIHLKLVLNLLTGVRITRPEFI